MTTHAASPARYSAHVKARGRANPLPSSYTITRDVTSSLVATFPSAQLCCESAIRLPIVTGRSG